MSAPMDRINACRSRAWVDSLSARFRDYYGSEVCVFSKYEKMSRERFGLNELLYDICVCRTATCISPVHGKTLHYVCKPLWQVESEFAHDTQQTMFDFNKLVLGSADQKLLVVPATPHPEHYLDTVADAAGCCTGRIYVAFVPAPHRWEQGGGQVRIFEFINHGWNELRNEDGDGR